MRCLVAVLLLVGEGREDEDVVTKLLDIESIPCKPAYNMVSDLPLSRISWQKRKFDHTNSTLLAMLETGQLSDYKLLCEEEVLDVHKMILAARSPYFVELMMKNPEQCVITNVDMETLKLLVKFTT